MYFFIPPISLIVHFSLHGHNFHLEKVTKMKYLVLLYRGSSWLCGCGLCLYYRCNTQVMTSHHIYLPMHLKTLKGYPIDE